ATIIQPDDTEDPGLWELLSEGHLARGDVEQAVRLSRTGADHAEARGDLERAWLMRYRAAAILLRAGELERAAEALEPLATIARDPDRPAPDEQRPGASLLQALAIGRLASISGDRSAYES